ncbi:MAG: hypothetical protein SF051_05120, partial [Elusimicrobiota bacterium]|nr:hypothetical protein [Elusimicrobiota bacterium]
LLADAVEGLGRARAGRRRAPAADAERLAAEAEYRAALDAADLRRRRGLESARYRLEGMTAAQADAAATVALRLARGRASRGENGADGKVEYQGEGAMTCSLRALSNQLGLPFDDLSALLRRRLGDAFLARVEAEGLDPADIRSVAKLVALDTGRSLSFVEPGSIFSRVAGGEDVVVVINYAAGLNGGGGPHAVNLRGGSIKDAGGRTTIEFQDSSVAGAGRPVVMPLADFVKLLSRSGGLAFGRDPPSAAQRARFEAETAEFIRRQGAPAAAPVAAAPAPVRVGAAELPPGAVFRRLGPGRGAPLEIGGARVERLGGGAFKDVYAHPGSDELVLKVFSQVNGDTRADSLAEARRERRGNAALEAIGRAPRLGETGIARFEAGGKVREVAYLTQQRFHGRDLATALREGTPESRARARAEARALVEDLVKARLRLDDNLGGDHAAKFGQDVGYGRLPGDAADRALVLDAGDLTRVPEPGLMDRLLGRPDPLRVHYEGVLRALERGAASEGPVRVGAADPAPGRELRMTWLDRSMPAEKVAVARRYHGVAHALADRIAAAGGPRPEVRFEASVLGSPLAPLRLWWQTVFYGTPRQRLTAFSPVTLFAVFAGTLGATPVEGVSFKDGRLSAVSAHGHSYGLATGGVLPLVQWGLGRLLEPRGNKPAHELAHAIEYLALGLARQRGVLESPGEIMGVHNDARLYLWGGRNERATIAAEYTGRLDRVFDMLRLNGRDFFRDWYKADPAYARERAARFDEFVQDLQRELAAENPGLFERGPRDLAAIELDLFPPAASARPDAAPVAPPLPGVVPGLSPRLSDAGDDGPTRVGASEGGGLFGWLRGAAPAPSQPPRPAAPRWVVEDSPFPPKLPAGLRVTGPLPGAPDAARGVYAAEAGGTPAVLRLDATPNEPRVLAAMAGVGLPDNVRVPRLLGAGPANAGALSLVEGGRAFDAGALGRAERDGRWLVVVERPPEGFVPLTDATRLAAISRPDWQGLLDAVAALQAKGIGFGGLGDPGAVSVRQVPTEGGGARTEFRLDGAARGTLKGRPEVLADDRARLKGEGGLEARLIARGLLSGPGYLGDPVASARGRNIAPLHQGMLDQLNRALALDAPRPDGTARDAAQSVNARDLGEVAAVLRDAGADAVRVLERPQEGRASDAVKIEAGGRTWYLKRVSQTNSVLDDDHKALSPADRAGNELAMREIVRRWFGRSFGVAPRAVAFEHGKERFVLTEGAAAAPDEPRYRAIEARARADYAVLKLVFRAEDLNKTNILFGRPGEKPVLIDFEKVIAEPLPTARMAKFADDDLMLKGFPVASRTEYNDPAVYREAVAPWRERFADPAFRGEFSALLRRAGWDEARIARYLEAVDYNLAHFDDHLGAYLTVARKYGSPSTPPAGYARPAAADPAPAARAPGFGGAAPRPVFGRRVVAPGDDG